MKTFLTLITFSLFTVAAMAADKRPTVIIKSKRNFEIVVDGKKFQNDNSIRIDWLRRGMHTITVYERSRGFFGNRLRPVSSRNFMVRNNDIRITVNYAGYVDIDEIGNGRDKDRGWNDGNRDRDRDRDDRDYDRDRRH
jgi:hypothetical protein